MELRTTAGVALLALGVSGALLLVTQRTEAPELEPVQVADLAPAEPLPAPTVKVQAVPLPGDGDVTAVRFALKGGYIAVEQRAVSGHDRLFMGHIAREGVTRVVEVVAAEPEEGESLGSPSWMRQPVMLQHERCLPSGVCTLQRMSAKPSAKSKPLLSADKTPSLADRHPSVSPDGATLSWIGDGDVYTWPRGAEAPLQHTHTGKVAGPMAWSEDGRLVFAEGEEGARRIGVLDRDTAELTWLTGGDRVGPAVDRTGRIWWLRPAGDGFTLEHEGPEGVVVVAEQVRGSEADGVALSERGDHVAYTTLRDEDAGRVFIQRLSDGKVFSVDTGLRDVAGVALAQGFGQMWLGASGFPAGTSHRGAVLIDVTPVVGEQEVFGTLIQKKTSPQVAADQPGDDGVLQEADGN